MVTQAAKFCIDSEEQDMFMFNSVSREEELCKGAEKEK